MIAEELLGYHNNNNNNNNNRTARCQADLTMQGIACWIPLGEPSYVAEC